VTSHQQDLTLASRYCAGALIQPDVERNPSILRAVLDQFQRRVSGCGVLFPTTDTAVLTVAALQGRLEPYVTPIPNRSVAETMVLKDRFYQSLRAHGIPHPRTLDPTRVAFETLSSRMSFPVYVRPQQSLLFHERIGGKGLVASTPQALRQALRVMQAAGLTAIVQEIIPGPLTAGFTMWGYFDQRACLNVVIVTQTVRQPRMFANACIIRSVPRAWIRDFEPVLLGYFQALQYRGLFGAEFKRDSRDGRFKLLEVNARSMSGNAMALSCGVNHVLAAYRDVLGQPIAPQLQYRSGVYHLDSFVALPLLCTHLVRGRLHPHDLELLRHRRHWHIWSRRDPRPWLRALRQSIFRLPRAFHSS
jgi:predicted ATP-grasp superfamily ATP-dependent carboligase